ncbi:hypothetical protein BJY54_006945 [Streptomyces nodosus]|nr:hypothetical protein [Streptomyces nodosus]
MHRAVEHAYTRLHLFERLRVRHEIALAPIRACSNWPAASYASAACKTHSETISYSGVHC